ncbi:TlrC/CarA/OleB/SrmB family ABC-F type ribosomal protection protein [Streptomyces sp. NWU339]|uniref:TlrC/CarA/OleB/SrmB family ABC-F type ribosomal protection protein n=1 Tax=Streptomyces sp. NWU339 TaxID=2185284 RepID=UPI000D67F8CF|nr:TlrC/CarA/OleB/SrmB family ABC-F type ribosomal protection protein [Streptomyces sp. NWU339]PWI09082.1 TlrC/CarA/OleB/SrmB family ABC-F type ribosomal protection protein [Streptomyces sp. NWU339]
MSIAQCALHDITKRYHDCVVLDRVGFSIRPGEKVGVIGDNGSGKSTLLKVLAGREQPDNGTLTVVAPGGVGYLAQTLELPLDSTVQDAVDLALSDLRELEAATREAEAELAEHDTDGTGPELSAVLQRYAGLVEQYQARGGYEADVRVEIALHGLGLPSLDRDRKLGTLSGGERSRLALAATLASAPELLLLDEPTNDLDDRATEWLEEHLRSHRGTVIAVTHDRVFLDRLTTTILEVGSGRVTRYGNGYEGYLSAKAVEREQRLREYEEWRAELDRNHGLIASNVARMDGIPRKMPLSVFGHGAYRRRGRDHGAMVRIRNAKQRVAQLTENPVPTPADPLSFTARIATAGQEAEEAVAELTDVRVTGRLAVASLRIRPGERLLVTGPNGAGKSTLLRVLSKELEPDSGSVRVDCRVGHLRQDEIPWPPELTVLGAFAHGRDGYVEDHAGKLLSLGLFSPSDLRRRVKDQSYGQRRRIEIARLVSDPMDLLLLDEPTNHLTPVLVEELEQALVDYQGAVVVVTHDRRMRSRFTGSRLTVDHGRITEFTAV